MMKKERYYWINKASEGHKRRMLTLSDAESLIGDVRGVKDERYMMYRQKVITPPDGGRIYEFLIEYDTYNPTQGIYLGCKSLTFPGENHYKEIENAIRDWDNVRDSVIQRLNNTFFSKDFTSRFRDTDNDHNNTFWPFWISLYEDEEPKEVGLRVLDVIYKTYKDYFDGTLPSMLTQHSVPKKTSLITAFTQESFLSLEERVKKNLRKHISKTHLIEGAWDVFINFIRKGEQEGWLQRLSGYEKAWCLSDEYGDVDFHVAMKLLFEKIGEEVGLKEYSVPWESLIRVFLRADGSAYKIQVKTLQPSAFVRRFWKEKLQVN